MLGPLHSRSYISKEYNQRRAFVSERWAGFSMLEMVIVLAISMTLMAIASPYIMGVVYGMRVRYSTYEISSLLQRSRIESVRRNTFYSVQRAPTPAGAPVSYYADFGKNSTVLPSDPIAPLGTNVNVAFGVGSGAPGEGAFLGALGYAVNGAAVLPTFNARGLPCTVVGNTCPETPGQGFVYFLSNNSMPGNTLWAAVTVTPSGRVQVWTYDGAAWNQQ